MTGNKLGFYKARTIETNFLELKSQDEQKLDGYHSGHTAAKHDIPIS